MTYEEWKCTKCPEVHYPFYIGTELAMQAAFEASDKAAREECAEICEQMSLYTALDAADRIRESIT